MKIGILTLPLVSNNGGILQAYALQRYLGNLGHEIILLDRRHQPSKFHYIKRLIINLLFNRKYYSREEYLLLNKNPFNFISKYITPQSQSLLSRKALKKYIDKEQIDALIVGSDQVWRLDYAGEIGLNFFLDFKPNRTIKKLSYAASFGRDTWNEGVRITNKVRNLLRDFDAISVREESGVSLCANIFGVEAIRLIDPTLLLDKEDYIELIIKEGEKPKNKQFFYYFLDKSKEKTEFALECANNLNIQPFTFDKLTDESGNIQVDSVTSWLRCFWDAEFIVTDSFHGCVFSIIFNKPFLAVANIERGLARFDSLMGIFGLENRLVLNIKEFDFKFLDVPINYKEIRRILSIEQEKVKQYFENVL